MSYEAKKTAALGSASGARSGTEIENGNKVKASLANRIEFYFFFAFFVPTQLCMMFLFAMRNNIEFMEGATLDMQIFVSCVGPLLDIFFYAPV